MKKLLIVDDNPQNRYMLQVLLSSKGFQVEQASNGVEALERARHAPPDMIISDILMPVMDGYALCRAWKQDERLKNIPFVFYTATYSDCKDEDFALSLGADRFIIKPVEPDKFLDMIMETSANFKAGKPVAKQQPVEETGYYKEYSAILIRKLENKMLQLQEAKRSLERDIAERKQMEDMLRATLNEKEILVRETHHRVKNNMQLISSLLQLQSEAIKDGAIRRLFNDAKDRIRSMALVHEKLYREKNIATIEFTAYINDLIIHLFRSYGIKDDRIHFRLDAGKVKLGMEDAIPVALILNELISNALKHAFPDNRKGEISMRIEYKQGKVRIELADNGIGMTKDLPIKNTLGLKLVQVLTEQINGSIKLEKRDGTHCILSFTKKQS